MTKPNEDLKMVQYRRKQIVNTIEKLHKEDKELVITERVLLRIAGVETLIEEPQFTPKRRHPPRRASTGGQIIEVLKDQQGIGNYKGLISRDILCVLRGTSKPDLVRTSFSPPLSRLCKSGEVINNDGIYRLAQREEGEQE